MEVLTTSPSTALARGDLISGYSDYGSLGYYSISGTILNGDLPGTHTVAVSYADAITDLNFGNWSNVAPVFADQAFSVPENSTDGTLVGTLAATDANSDSLFYNITSNADPDADGNAAFRVEGDQLLVNDADDFDYETNPQLVITVEASDGSLTDTATLTVDLTAVNEAPEFSYPDPQSVAEDTDLVFSTAGGNPLGLSDEDAGDAKVGMRIEADYGLLTLPQTTGLTFIFGSSNGSHSITVLGTLVDINAALEGFIYSPLAEVPRCRRTQPHGTRPGQEWPRRCPDELRHGGDCDQLGKRCAPAQRSDGPDHARQHDAFLQRRKRQCHPGRGR